MKKEGSTCIVTIVFDEQAGGSNTLIHNIINIFNKLEKKIYLVSSEFTKKQIEGQIEVKHFKLKFIETDFFLLKMVRHFMMQMQISYIVYKLRHEVDSGFYFIAGSLLLPILTARFIGKDAVLVNPAPSYGKITSEYNGKNIVKHIIAESENMLTKFSQKFSTKIVLSTKCLTETLDLNRDSNNIYYAPGEFIHNHQFYIKTKHDLRGNVVGYIGRLSPEKGIMNFIKSIPEIRSKDASITFIIIGGGPLKKEIEELIDFLGLNDCVLLREWVPRYNIIDYLNNIKLIVLPSYTEGLPNIILESMACGTPVLANSIGSIPDIIEDEKTGFIMQNNSPSCIANNVIRALKSPLLEEISKNAAKLIELEYSYEAAVQKYSYVFRNE